MHERVYERVYVTEEGRKDLTEIIPKMCPG